MIKLRPWRVLSIPISRSGSGIYIPFITNRGARVTREWGDNGYDGWGANINPSRDYINSVIFNNRVTFRRPSGITTNPSRSAFYRINRWVRR